MTLFNPVLVSPFLEETSVFSTQFVEYRYELHSDTPTAEDFCCFYHPKLQSLSNYFICFDQHAEPASRGNVVPTPKHSGVYSALQWPRISLCIFVLGVSVLVLLHMFYLQTEITGVSFKKLLYFCAAGHWHGQRLEADPSLHPNESTLCLRPTAGNKVK